MKLANNLYALWTNKQREAPRLGAFSVDESKACELNEQGFDIFWTPNGFEKGKRKKEDLLFINCFYADLDSGTHEEMQAQLCGSLKPSCVISTGRGFHVYWYLEKEIETLGKAEAACNWFRLFLTERIKLKINIDVQAADACRLLRPPFYRYWKDNLGSIYTDIVFDSGEKYSLEMISKYFPKGESKISLPTRNNEKTLLGRGFWDKANNISAVDAFNKLSGSQVVDGQTYSLRRQNNRIRLWINEKPANVWIDDKGKIGSTDQGGPSVPNWINWYLKDWSKTAKVLKELWPEIGE